MESRQFTCVLPSAGSGSRASPTSVKQLESVLGRPIFMFTVDNFLSHHNCGKIVLVVPPEQLQVYEDHLAKCLSSGSKGGCSSTGNRIVVVEGSTARHRSIAAAKQVIEELNMRCREIVVVHDVVRPFIDVAVLDQLVAAAETDGAAGVSRPLTSTVLECDSEMRLVASLDRASHLASETPQAFRWDVFSAMYDQCSKDDLDNGTECLALAQKYARTHASLVPGTDVFWKITYQKDLISARCLINRQNLQQLYLVVKSPVQSRFFSQLLSSLFNDVHELLLEDLLDRNPDRLLSHSQSTFLFAATSPEQFTACLDGCVSLSTTGSTPWSGFVFLIVTRLQDLTKKSYICLRNAVQIINNANKGNWLGLVCYEGSLGDQGGTPSVLNGQFAGEAARGGSGASPGTSRRSGGSSGESMFTKTREANDDPQKIFSAKAVALMKDLIENRTLSTTGSVSFI